MAIPEKLSGGTRKVMIEYLEEKCGDMKAELCLTNKCPIFLKNPDCLSSCLAFTRRTDKEVCEAYINMSGNYAAEREEAPVAKREELLHKAIECITGHRVGEYGKPEDSFGKIAKFWTAYNGHEYTTHDVAMMMALLKVARIRTGHGGEDSYIDLAGYAACAGEMAQNDNQ